MSNIRSFVPTKDGYNLNRFKVANAVNADEALNKGQLSAELQAIGGFNKTNDPILALSSTTLNELTSTNVSITNYEIGLVYTTQTSNASLGTAVVTGTNLVITAGDILSGHNEQITIGLTAKGLGINTSNVTNITVNIAYVPSVADTTIQVIDIFNDLATNTGFIGV